MALAVGVATLLLPASGAAAERCGDGEAGPRAVERRAPEYPRGAREAGLEGSVEVELTVLRDGRTGWVRVRRAEPAGLFEAAAVDAVRDWRFEPALRDGDPVECRARSVLRFTLTDEVVPGPPASDGPGRPLPIFPEAARAAGLEGYVRVEYRVDLAGAVVDIVVLEAVPRDAFAAGVRETLAGWRYAAAARPQGRVTREFTFRLPEYARATPVVVQSGFAYPVELCEAAPRARLQLEVEVGADGRVRAARLADAQPAAAGALGELAVRQALASRRTPARRAGQAVDAPGLLTADYDPDRTCAAGREERRAPRGPRPPRVGAVTVR